MHARVPAILALAAGLVCLLSVRAVSQESADAPPAASEPATMQDLSRRLHAIWTVLDRLHIAASDADFDAYFALYTPNAVFLGTDATERWTLDEFKAYTKTHFDDGNGWTYTSRNRFVNFAPVGRTAWFDELLDNDKYGECRGSGVLLYGNDGKWRIAQYNLTKTIPNDKMEAVVTAINAAPAQ